MNINITYDVNFTELMLFLKAKYGSKMFELDGIDGQLDINKFSKDFFGAGVTTDISIDSNSNVSTKDMIIYNTELPKPYFRLNAYYLIWKKLKALYGQLEANRIIEMQLCGDIYINDFHGVALPYCFNFSTYDIALEGLTMVNKIKSIAPKYLYSFKSQLEQFVTIASNSTLGATGLADLFIVMAYYVDKILETKSDAGFNFATELDCWKYIKENIASFIYTINQPMRVSQSPFTNVSLFDRNFLESLAPEYKWPDGRFPKIETIEKLQMIYVDIMNKEMERTPITFPVTTACFTVDENNDILDHNFLSLIAEKNLKYGFINMYCGKTSTLSSCCFKGDEFIKYEDEFGVKHISTIKNFVEKYTDDIGEGKIDDLSKIISMNPTTQELEPTNITGFLCKTNEYKKLIKFTVGDNEIFVTPDHLFLAKHKVTGKIVEIKAEDLKDSFMLYQLPISEQN